MAAAPHIAVIDPSRAGVRHFAVDQLHGGSTGTRPRRDIWSSDFAATQPPVEPAPNASLKVHDLTCPVDAQKANRSPAATLRPGNGAKVRTVPMVLAL